MADFLTSDYSEALKRQSFSEEFSPFKISRPINVKKFLSELSSKDKKMVAEISHFFDLIHTKKQSIDAKELFQFFQSIGVGLTTEEKAALLVEFLERGEFTKSDVLYIASLLLSSNLVLSKLTRAFELLDPKKDGNADAGTIGNVLS
jgi:Ca2+-binding EF-hand superfamily protein